MALPQEVIGEVFQVIEGGKILGSPAEIIQFPTDNGAHTYNVFKNVFKGDNGTGFNYWVVAFETLIGEVTCAVSAGAAMLTMEVGLVGVAVAPALGLTTGYVLYNLAPNFWDSVANALMEAGETIGGKVVVFMNENGTLTYSQTTIEIIKQAFVDSGVFDNADGIDVSKLPSIWELSSPITAGDFNIDYPYPSSSDINPRAFPMSVGGKSPSSGYQGNLMYTGLKTRGIALSSLNKYRVTLVKHQDDNVPIMLFASDTDYINTLYLKADFWTEMQWAGGGAFYTRESQFTYDNKTVYYNAFHTQSSYVDNPQFYYEFSDANVETGSDTMLSKIAWSIIYGEEYANEGLQDGALYPDDDPFPLRYPEWYPYEFPDVDGQQLPARYPLQYPEILPETEPYQDPAQNPEQSPNPVKETNPDAVVDPLTDPDNEPNPFGGKDPEDYPVDPDIPDDPDPIPPDPEPTPDPDPIDPNPEPTPSPIIPVPDLPDTVASSKLFTVYNPTQAQIDSLGGYLWDSSIMAAIRDIWQEPLDGIISLIKVHATPVTSGSHNIILGYLDSGVSSAVVGGQFVTVDCGSVTVNEKRKNATDYAPYTSMHLFLPFIGFVELDPNECMKSTIGVKYKVDVYTGTCLATVSVTRTKDMPNSPILYSFSGNCAQQVPLTSGNATGMLSALIGGVTAGLAVASGGGLGVLAGASIAGKSLTHDMFHVNHSGNISANAGIMGNKKPYLIIGRRQNYDANTYNKFYGFPVNASVFLGNHTGFIKVKSCLLKTRATDPEHDEIMQLLKDGVIL